jgi:hypothetical protein
MRLPRLRRSPALDEREEWMATARGFAQQLTEAGSRCHLNDGSVRFCHWQAEELPPTESGGEPLVGVRCTIHPGGRYLDSTARLAPDDFAPTR